MTKLNCGVGDLAITVNCINPENMGNIVYVLRPSGYKQCNHQEDKVFAWEVLVVGANSWLLYEIDGWPVSKKIGSVPDYCLRRITPPKNTSKNIKNNKQDNPQQGILDFTKIDLAETYLVKEIKEENQTKAKEQINLYLAHVLI
jgi:hypothetical protein